MFHRLTTWPRRSSAPCMQRWRPCQSRSDFGPRLKDEVDCLKLANAQLWTRSALVLYWCRTWRILVPFSHEHKTSAAPVHYECSTHATPAQYASIVTKVMLSYLKHRVGDSVDAGQIWSRLAQPWSSPRTTCPIPPMLQPLPRPVRRPQLCRATAGRFPRDMLWRPTPSSTRALLPQTSQIVPDFRPPSSADNDSQQRKQTQKQR